mgnify:CR=1 FL=1
MSNCHHAVLEVARDQPPVHRVGAEETGDQRHGHDEPEASEISDEEEEVAVD